MPFITRVKRQKRSRDRKENGKFTNATNRRSRVGLSTPFYTETKGKQTNLAFCHNISTISYKPKAYSHEKMAFNRTTTITERNLQESAPYFIQKRAFAQRYTRESQTMKKAKTRARESCRPVNPILHTVDLYQTGPVPSSEITYTISLSLSHKCTEQNNI